jgi:phage terminase large subunit-like protein
MGRDLFTPASLPFFSKAPLTLDQLTNVYDYVERIINDLDEEALTELLSGNEKDLDGILLGLATETNSVLHSHTGKVKTASFGYLDKLTESVEDTMRKLSFNYFITSCLPDFEMNWHHIEWGNLVQIYKYLCIIASRDHSKSFTFSKAYPLWKMYRYAKDTSLTRAPKEYKLSKEGILVTNEFGLAKHLLGLIREEIESNDILNPILMPDQKTEGWGKEGIKCKNGASLIIKSYGSKMRGFHPGYMVVDDFLNESNMYSKEQRDKYIDFMHSVIMNMIVPGGQVVTVGTPFHEADLYADLKAKRGWKVFEYPALFPNGEVLWAGRHSLAGLLEKKETQGSLVFSREILVRPVSNESSIFPWPILERAFLGMDTVTLAPNIVSSQKKFTKVVIGCDFAISASVGADYSVFTVIGVDDLEQFWLLNIWREKGATYNEQMAAIKRLNSDYRPDIIMAEDNAMQKIFIQMMKDANLPVVSHTTGINKYNLENGVPALAVLFEQGRMRFPRGDQKSKDITDLICGELASMTFTDKGKLEGVGEHDDCAMSLWISIRAAKYIRQDFDFSFM